MLSLARRNKVYYARFRVPVDLQPHFGRSEIIRSLHTIIYRSAKSLLNRIAGEAERICLMLRSGILTDDEIQRFVRQMIDSMVRFNDAGRNKERMTGNTEVQAEIDQYNETLDKVTFALPGGYEMYLKGMELMLALHRRKLAMNQAHTVPEVQNLLELMQLSTGTEILTDSPQYTQACNEILKGIIRADSITLEHLKGNFETDYDLEQRTRKKSHSLKHVLNKYVEDQQAGQRKRREKADKVMECFQYETGKDDILLSDIDRDITRAVAERLLRYPKHRHLKYRGKTLAEIYQMDGVQYPALSTQAEELFFLSSVYQFAINGYDGLERNFAAGLAEKLVEQDKRKASEYRDIFRPADIQEIVTGLTRMKQKGVFAANPHLLLIPLIALFQGARANEICQLHIPDIACVDGLWCMSINEDGGEKSVKTDSSRRVNPIHPTLIDLGLIRFWQAQKDRGCSRLWEGEGKISCAYYESKDSFSHYFVKWFNGTFKNGLTLSNPEKQSFHSTRHTVANWFRQNLKMTEHGEAVQALLGHMDKDDINALEAQGWDTGAETFRTYAKDLNMKRQFETLKHLDYGIDFTPLAL